MKLFAVYVGGECKGGNIEVHDMRFVMAESIEQTYAELRRQWWGIPYTLHIDCWAELNQADGYRVSLNTRPSADNPKLYYVNLGGYDPNQFTELHSNMFVVAETDSKAKIRALKTVRHWQAFHKDDMHAAEQTISLGEVAGNQRHYIHLEKIDDPSQPSFTCHYKNIGKLKEGTY